jgi:Kdo2-lipid IVA lauroyltransferase/acyltransferase
MKNRATKVDFSKSIIRWLSRCGVRGVRVMFRVMPWSVFRVLFPFFRWIASVLLQRKTAIIQANLRIAYADCLDEHQRRNITHRCLWNFSSGLIELGYWADRPQSLKEKVTIEGGARLDEALQGGRGVILLGAHFGNFILMYLALVQHGYQVNVIMKPSHDPRMETYLESYRRSQKIQTIYSLPARECVVHSLKALKRDEILIILLDQNFGGDGRVFVDFFGQSAATATGPVIFAQRSGAPILPLFMTRSERSFCHTLNIGEPLALTGDPRSPDFARENIQMMTRMIEARIREVPHEWAGWMHKRWKTRTIEEQTEIDRIHDEGGRATTFYGRS